MFNTVRISKNMLRAIEEEFGSVKDTSKNTEKPYIYIGKLERSDNLYVVVYPDQEIQFLDTDNIEKLDSDKLICHMANLKDKFKVEFNVFSTIKLIPKKGTSYVASSVKLLNKFVKFYDNITTNAGDIELLSISENVFNECILDAIKHNKMYYCHDSQNFKIIKLIFSLPMLEKYDVELNFNLSSRKKGPNDYDKEVYQRQKNMTKHLAQYLSQNNDFMAEKERTQFADECTFNKLNTFYQEKIDALTQENNILTEEKINLQKKIKNYRTELDICRINNEFLSQENKKFSTRISEIKITIDDLKSILQTSGLNCNLAKENINKILDIEQTQLTDSNLATQNKFEEIEQVEQIEESPKSIEQIEQLFSFVNVVKSDFDEFVRTNGYTSDDTVNELLNSIKSNSQSRTKLQILLKCAVQMLDLIAYWNRNLSIESLSILNKVMSDMCKADEILNLILKCKTEKTNEVIAEIISLDEKLLSSEDQIQFIQKRESNADYKSIYFLLLLSYLNLTILKHQDVHPKKLLLLCDMIDFNENNLTNILNTKSSGDESSNESSEEKIAKLCIDMILCDDVGIVKSVRDSFGQALDDLSNLSDFELLLKFKYFNTKYEPYIPNFGIDFIIQRNDFDKTIMKCCEDLLKTNQVSNENKKLLLSFRNNKELKKRVGIANSNISSFELIY